MYSDLYEPAKGINPELLGDASTTAVIAEPDPVRDSAVAKKKKTKLPTKKKIIYGVGGVFGLIVLVTLLLVVGVIPVPQDPDSRQVITATEHIEQAGAQSGHSASPPAQVEKNSTNSEPDQEPEQNQTVMDDTPATKTPISSQAPMSLKNALTEPGSVKAVSAATSPQGGLTQATSKSDDTSSEPAIASRLEEQNARLVKMENQLIQLSSQFLALKEDQKNFAAMKRSAATNSVSTPAHARRPISVAKVTDRKEAVNNANQIAIRSLGKRTLSEAQFGVITESRTNSDSSGKVQILGITSKAGGGYVVLSFAGIKKRYEKGESVPALGPINDFGSENGVPYVEIAGVTYR